MRNLTIEELKQISGGEDCPDNASKDKGNNGWGNGFDPINPGSCSGETESSKHDNTGDVGAGTPNENPNHLYR